MLRKLKCRKERNTYGIELDKLTTNLTNFDKKSLTMNRIFELSLQV